MSTLGGKIEFLEKFGIPEEGFIETGLEWQNLEEIYNHFFSIRKDIDLAGKSILERLLSIENVHSVRYRIKNPEHLIEKIIRKKREDKNRVIDINNYLMEITDLIGLRIIHLYKNSWLPIHKGLIDNFEPQEKKVYFRIGDDVDYLKKFEDEGIKAMEHRAGYRSIHYTVKTKPARQEYSAEIQVRTIFEEGWSEIDHDIRYPYESDNALYNTISLILNRLAGSADELATFIVAMRASIEENKEEVKRLKKEIDKSNLGAKEKEVIKAGISGSGSLNELFRQQLAGIAATNSTRMAAIVPPSFIDALQKGIVNPRPDYDSLSALSIAAAAAARINSNPLGKIKFPPSSIQTDLRKDEEKANGTLQDNKEGENEKTE